MIPPSILFFDDYSEGAHPRILEALGKMNLQQGRGYGEDFFTAAAARLIREKINKSEAVVHFVATGTQANLISIAALLKPYESVIATQEGHIAVHETGAIEATGHKVNTVPCTKGKITPEAIEQMVLEHRDEHMVQPRVVYLSQATEVGTIYSKKELQEIYQRCQANQLYLYIDGARIGNAVMSHEADFHLQDIADCCDLFYLGGTKNGALFGEAIVIVNPKLQSHFRYHIKQRGALMAKTRTMAVSFMEFFQDNLYFENARHANEMAYKLAEGIKSCGYEFLEPVSTNQLFPILPKNVITQLEKKYGFYTWSPAAKANHSVIRLVTSWATQEEAVEAFLYDLSLVS